MRVRSTLGMLVWASLSVLAAGTPAAWGDSPLALSITETPDTSNASLNDYSFKLVLDNHDGSWAAGQGFGGLVFGDVKNAPSPIADFAIDPSSFPVGPWTRVDMASGFHNGPIFGPEVDGSLNPIVWVPSGVGDSLQWSGTSAYDLRSGCLAFSTLFVTNSANPATFQMGICSVSPVPEPGGWALLGTGLLTVLAFARFRSSF
jgi:hypothetical protein